MWWLSQSTRGLQAKWELSAFEKHVPTSCLSDALRGIHALNSDVLPEAPSSLFYHHTGLPVGHRKCLKYLGEGVIAKTSAMRKTSLIHGREIEDMEVCIDRNLSAQFKDNPYKNRMFSRCRSELTVCWLCTDSIQRSLGRKKKKETHTARSHPNRSGKWITMCYWEPL